MSVALAFLTSKHSYLRNQGLIEKKNDKGEAHIYCVPCKKVFKSRGVDKSHIDAHVCGDKCRKGDESRHAKRLKEYNRSKKSEADIRTALRAAAESGEVVQEQLSEETLLLRCRSLKACLQSGLPVNAVLDGGIGSLIEEGHGATLGHSSDMMALYVKRLLEQEDICLKGELHAAEGSDPLQKLDIPVAVSYDGTPDPAGEVVATVIRMVDESNPSRPTIVHRLIGLEFLQEHVDAGKLSGLLLNHLSDVHLGPENVVTVSSDGCSTNLLADEMMRASSTCNYDAMLIKCFSHMISNSGFKAQLPFLDAFVCYIRKVFAHSMDARDAMKKVVGESLDMGADHRWWYKHDLHDFVYRNWEHLPVVFQRLIDKGTVAYTIL